MNYKKDLDEFNYKRYEAFFSKYQLETRNATSDFQSKYWLGEKKGICRFCNREVKIKGTAHVIPEFLGNKYLFSNFECQDCNQKFKLYEDSFANYLKAYRTIVQIKGKEGIPKYNKSNLVIRSEENGSIIFISPEVSNINSENIEKISKIDIITTKEPYVPVYIFKILTKIALCFIPEEDTQYFNDAFQFVIDNNVGKDMIHKSILQAKVYFIPGLIAKRPIIELYKKKFAEDLAIERIFILYYGNLIIQIPLILNKADAFLYQSNAQLEIPIFPLLIEKSWFEEYGEYQLSGLDLSSWEKIKNEPLVLEMKIENLQQVQNNNPIL